MGFTLFGVLGVPALHSSLRTRDPSDCDYTHINITVAAIAGDMQPSSYRYWHWAARSATTYLHIVTHKAGRSFIKNKRNDNKFPSYQFISSNISV